MSDSAKGPPPPVGVPAKTVPCAKCGRPIAEQAKRCLYCGHYRITAEPGTPEHAAQTAAAAENAKQMARQAALYGAGVGLSSNRSGGGGGGFADKMRHQSVPVRLLVGSALILLLVVVPVPKLYRMAKDILKG